jgi:hypothetical protein
MSPEQVRRESLTGQTDLFSLGVLAWEMLAGRRLFARADADATLAAVLDEPIPPPSSVRPEVPAKLDEVVMRALERDRSARWTSAGDMLAQLNKYLYSLDETPGARDVAALVARYCPPETRRLPTHADAAEAEAAGAPAGPRTAVIPRDGVARGRPRRHQTFATNVDMKEMLDRATPLLGVDAIRDEPPAARGETTPGADATKPDERAEPGTEATKPTAARAAADAGTAANAASEPDPNVTARLSKPPSRATLVLVGLGGLALAAGSVYVFFANRERVMRGRPDAGAFVMYFDAPVEDASGDAPDEPRDAGVDDAAPADAGREPPRDAGTRRSDAARATPDAGIAKGTGTLKVGATPWGEIYIDGKLVGRTPRELSVPAGHHTVEIVFPAETPPRKQTFAVDLATGETKPLQADFSN